MLNVWSYLNVKRFAILPSNVVLNNDTLNKCLVKHKAIKPKPKWSALSLNPITYTLALPSSLYFLFLHPGTTQQANTCFIRKTYAISSCYNLILSLKQNTDVLQRPLYFFLHSSTQTVCNYLYLRYVTCCKTQIEILQPA